MESNLYFGLLDLGSLASSPCGSKQWKLGYVGFLVYTGGGLDGCGVGGGGGDKYLLVYFYNKQIKPLSSSIQTKDTLVITVC